MQIKIVSILSVVLSCLTCFLDKIGQWKLLPKIAVLFILTAGLLFAPHTYAATYTITAPAATDVSLTPDLNGTFSGGSFVYVAFIIRNVTNPTGNPFSDCAYWKNFGIGTSTLPQLWADYSSLVGDECSASREHMLGHLEPSTEYKIDTFGVYADETWYNADSYYFTTVSESGPTPTPTSAPTPTPEPPPPSNGGGSGDGQSDGRSDGLSSCPSCTAAPPPSTNVPGTSTGQVLGASTTTLAATGTNDQLGRIMMGAVAALVVYLLGHALLRANETS